MPLWNLVSPHHTVALNVVANDQKPNDGAMTGTLTHEGAVYQVSGSWAASGGERKATAFALAGSTQVDPATFVAATGTMTGPSTAPIRVDIQLDASSSGDGTIQNYKGSLFPG